MDVGQYLLRETGAARQELAAQNRNLIQLRWIYVGIMGLAAVGAGLVAHRSAVTQYASIALAALLCNGLLFAASRVKAPAPTYYKVLALLQILLDLGIATAAIVVGGGIEARSIILYVQPLLVAGLFFANARLVYLTATLSLLSYGITIIVMEQQQLASLPWSQVLVPIIFYGVLFFVLARILLYFNERTIETTKDHSYEELLAMLTHQLRHPSSTMSAILDAMLTDKTLQLSPTTLHYLGMIQGENSHFQHLTDNLLEAARPTSVVTGENIDLKEVVSQVTRRVSRLHQRVGDVRLELPEQDVMVVGGPRLHIAFENLIDNALRYSRPGDPITITLVPDDQRPTVIIRDIGVGMTEEQKQTLFKQFGTTTVPKGAIPGAGLGLFVCHKILDTYGGNLAISTATDGGTEVHVNVRSFKP